MTTIRQFLLVLGLLLATAIAGAAKREKPSGVGDEAVLMKDDSGRMRYLVARKGNHSVVLFLLSKGATDEYLKKLALALSR